MKAISLWQPWASLWIAGVKVCETRHWATSHRGTLLVHAAKKLCIDLEPELIEICSQAFGVNWAKTLPRGALLGVGQLTGCRRGFQSLFDVPADVVAHMLAGGSIAMPSPQPRLL